MSRERLRVLFVLVIPLLAACNGTTSSTPQTISVSVSPTTASVATGHTQQFTAIVSSTSNTAVTWQVNGVTAGNTTVGTISTTGLYTAPNNPAMVTVKAIAQADVTKSASATVTVTSSSGGTLVVSPNPASVDVFGIQQFTATLNGQTASGVTWQVNGVTGGGTTTGTISTTGLFHAPNSVPTTSTSSGGSTATPVSVTAMTASASGSAKVTIVPPGQAAESPPIKLGTSGSNANDSSTSGSTVTCCGGTLGSLVSRAGTQYILSNNHVLARTDLGTVTNGSTLGDAITQPGLIDANCRTTGTNTVARLAQFVSLEANNDHPVADAAIAQVVSGMVDLQGTILELGGTTSGGLPTDGSPHAGSGVTVATGRPVAKSGRSTGLSCSTVLSVSTATSVTYQKGCGTGSTFTATYSNQIAVAGGDFSAEGDSGSLIVTQDTADAVALLFAGSDTDSVGNPVSAVLNALKDQSNNVPTFVGSLSAHPVATCSLPGPQAAMAARLAVQQVAPSQVQMKRGVLTRDLFAPALMAHPEVQALGVGASLDSPGEPAIVFFVTKGQPRTNLPAVVDGIRTRIIEGELFAQRGVLSAEQSAALEQAAAPPQMGYAISDAEYARAKPIHAAHVEEWMNKPGVQGVGNRLERGFAGRGGAGDLSDSQGGARADSGGDRRPAHACAGIQPLPCRFRRPRAAARVLAPGRAASSMEARGRQAEALAKAFRLKGDRRVVSLLPIA